MSERTFGKPTLAVRHVPDFSLEKDASGNNVQVELPGKVHVGVMLDGVFVPILERKAAGLFADIERAKKNAPDSADPEE